MHHDRRGKQQRRPVVNLADEEPAAHLEANVQRGFVGPGHLDAAQWLIDALVGDVGHGGIEEQRQVDTGEQQHDEAVHRDFAQQE